MNKITQLKALAFIKSNKLLLIKKFAGHISSLDAQPISIFMAGSPGAGKTEFSQHFLQSNKLNIMRIDADDIRKLVPLYTGKNSADIQAAATRGVHILYDHALKQNLSMLLDGTFAYDSARRNVIRSIKRGRYKEYPDVLNIDKIIKIQYTQEELMRKLK